MKTKNILYTGLVLFLVVLIHCNTSNKKTGVSFSKRVVSWEASNWWARKIIDINNDGYHDIVLQDNNAAGGWLGWFETPVDTSENWKLHIIADSSVMGHTFASGDIEAGDMDNDGDNDIIGFLHTGEWESDGDSSQIFWFENPDWIPHYVGVAPAFVKDVEIADFDKNNKLDIAVITFTKNSFQVYAQSDTSFYLAECITITNLHEGMSVGDIDGDGFVDVATNGYWIKSPGKDLTKEWIVKSIDEQWHNQEGDWSRNATKNFCADIDQDGKDEVFISHSERKNYPLAIYDLVGQGNNLWEIHVIDTIDACHTLQVFDFNGDGQLDVLAGENQQRWWENDDNDPVNIYYKKNGFEFFKETITTNGIYNGLAGDMDNDGDNDIIRLPGHSAKVLEVWYNK